MALVVLFATIVSGCPLQAAPANNEVPAGIKVAYKALANALHEKNAPKVLAVWSSNYTSNQRWKNSNKSSEMMSRQQAIQDLQSALPGNEHAPTADFALVSGKKDGAKFIVQSLWGVITLRDRGNADGVIRCTDTWERQGTSWKLFSHIKATDLKEQDWRAIETEYGAFASAKKIIQASVPLVFTEQQRVQQLMAVSPGDIGLSGSVVSIDWNTKNIVLMVTAFTLPGNKTKTMAAPKEKKVFFGKIESVQNRAKSPRVSSVDGIPVKSEVFVKGPDQGSGSDLVVREMVLIAKPK